MCVKEKAGTMTRVYYRDANAAVVVFDVTRNVSCALSSF